MKSAFLITTSFFALMLSAFGSPAPFIAQNGIISSNNIVIRSGTIIADASGLTNISASAITGTIPKSRLPGEMGSNAFVGTFTGNGAGVSNTVASQVLPNTLQSPLTIVAVADSQTSFANGNQYSYLWHLTNDFGWGGLGPVFNCGTNGQTLQGMTNGLAGSITAHAPGAGTNGLLIVLVGANGRNDGGGVWTPDEFFLTQSNYIQSAINVGFSNVVLITTMPNGTLYYPNAYLEANRRRLTDLQRRAPWRIVDADRLFPDITDTNIFYDQVHLTSEAATILAREVDRVLRFAPIGVQPIPPTLRQMGTNWVVTDSSGSNVLNLNAAGKLNLGFGATNLAGSVSLQTDGTIRTLSASGFSIGDDTGRFRIATTGPAGMEYQLLGSDNAVAGLAAKGIGVGLNYAAVYPGAGVVAAETAIGIGTQSLASGVRLDIRATEAAVNLQSDTSGKSAYIQIQNNGTASATYLGNERSPGGYLFTGSTAYATVLGSIYNYPLQLGAYGAIGITMLPGTRFVGINETTPTYPLTVNGGILASNANGSVAITNNTIWFSTNAVAPVAPSTMSGIWNSNNYALYAVSPYVTNKICDLR